MNAKYAKYAKTDCYLAIRDIMDHPPDDKILTKLLQATMDFLERTPPRLKTDRNGRIQPHHIEKIMQNAASALEAFKETGQKEDLYELCKYAIIERLQALAKDDKISIYYHTEGNAVKLKSLLSDDDHTHSPGKSM